MNVAFIMIYIPQILMGAYNYNNIG